MIKFTSIKKELVRDLVGINDPEILSVCRYLQKLNKNDNYGNYCFLLANQGSAEAQYVISKILQWGLMCDPNNEKSLIWCKKSVKKDFAPAFFLLGTYCFESDNCKAIELYLKAAKNDFVPALNMLGFCYSYGYSLKKNILKGIEYYERSIMLGSSEAMYNLSQLYLRESECLNIDKGMKLLKDSADRNFPDAHFILGNMYWNGDNGLQKNENLYKKHNEIMITIQNIIITNCLDGLV